jgi:hypothetical protein
MTRNTQNEQTYVPPEGDDTLKPDPKEDKKKEKSKYTEDPNDPAYIEPRLRPDWDPSQPG